MSPLQDGMLCDAAVFGAPKDNLFGEGLVSIVVGRKKMVQFDVHKMVLAQVSQAFANNLTDTNRQIKMGTLFLHDEDPTTFQHFVKWAYSQHGSRLTVRAPVAQLEEHLGGLTRTELLRLYLMADQFHARLLQDDITALFYDRLGPRGHKTIATLGVDGVFLSHLDGHLAAHAPLFQLLARALAFRMAGPNAYHPLPLRRDPLDRAHHAGRAHAYPAELSKTAMRCAALLLPERLLRAVMIHFFELRAVPVLDEYAREVGALEKFLVVQPGGGGNNS